MRNSLSRLWIENCIASIYSWLWVYVLDFLSCIIKLQICYNISAKLNFENAKTYYSLVEHCEAWIFCGNMLLSCGTNNCRAFISFLWITPVPWSNKKWTWCPMERAGIGDTRAAPYNGKPNICQLSFISLLQSESWASGTKSTKHIESVCVWFHMVLERPSFIESYPEEKCTLRPVCTTQKV